jgi:hypothetical protein
MEKRKFLILLGLELRPLNRPGRTQLLYRLRYRDTGKIAKPDPMELESLLRSRQFLSYSRVSRPQEPVTGPYPEPDPKNTTT